MRFMKQYGLVLIFFGLLAFCSPPPQMPVKEMVKDNMTIRGDYTQADMEYFLGFRTNIQQAMKTRNVDLSFTYYSRGFMSDTGVSLAELRKNTQTLYKVYKDIRYTVTDFKVNIQKETALSEDEFTFIASPRDKTYKPLDYKGKERIYWQKENGVWKIMNWVYE